MSAQLARQFGFTRTESAILAGLRKPEKIQKFLDDEVEYDPSHRCRSPRRLLAERRGHCVEGGLLACTALRLYGHPPLLLDLRAQRDYDHVVAVFRRDGLWGAIGKSNFAGLRYREPVYKSLRELAMSYFEHYFNDRGERTLRGYSRPVNLSRFDPTGWMTAEDDPWQIPNHLATLSQFPLIPRRVVGRLTPADPLLRSSGSTNTRRAS